MIPQLMGAVAAVAANPPWWLSPAATVVAAALGALGLVVVRKVRGPVAIQDLWTENRKLRQDLASLETKVNTLWLSNQHQVTVNQVMGEGFDALSRYVERTSTTPPTYTRQERDAVQRARALRADNAVWASLQPKSEGEAL